MTVDGDGVITANWWDVQMIRLAMNCPCDEQWKLKIGLVAMSCDDDKIKDVIGGQYWAIIAQLKGSFRAGFPEK